MREATLTKENHIQIYGQKARSRKEATIWIGQDTLIATKLSKAQISPHSLMEKSLGNKGKASELQRSSEATCGVHGVRVELVPARDHLLLVVLTA